MSCFVTVTGKRTHTNTPTRSTIVIHTTTLPAITGGIMGTGTDIIIGTGTGGTLRFTTTTGAGQMCEFNKRCVVGMSDLVVVVSFNYFRTW